MQCKLTTEHSLAKWFVWPIRNGFYNISMDRIFCGQTDTGTRACTHTHVVRSIGFVSIRKPNKQQLTSTAHSTAVHVCSTVELAGATQRVGSNRFRFRCLVNETMQHMSNHLYCCWNGAANVRHRLDFGKKKLRCRYTWKKKCFLVLCVCDYAQYILL